MAREYKILVIEDRKEFRDFARTVLQLIPGVTAYAAQDGKEALEIAGRESIDFCISDVFYPADTEQEGSELEQKAIAYLDKAMPSEEQILARYSSVKYYDPSDEKKLKNLKEIFAKAPHRYVDAEGELPTGIYIASELKARGIPVVAWSDLEGHGGADEVAQQYLVDKKYGSDEFVLTLGKVKKGHAYAINLIGAYIAGRLAKEGMDLTPAAAHDLSNFVYIGGQDFLRPQDSEDEETKKQKQAMQEMRDEIPASVMELIPYLNVEKDEMSPRQIRRMFGTR